MMLNLDVINGEIAALEAKEPTFATMERLAWLYIVRDHIIFGRQQENPESEFVMTAEEMNAGELRALLDEILETLKVTQPKLYEAILRRIERE